MRRLGVNRHSYAEGETEGRGPSFIIFIYLFITRGDRNVDSGSSCAPSRRSGSGRAKHQHDGPHCKRLDEWHN